MDSRHLGFPNNCPAKDCSDVDTWWTTEARATTKEFDWSTVNVLVPEQQAKLRKVFCLLIPNNGCIVITVNYAETYTVMIANDSKTFFFYLIGLNSIETP